MNDMTDWKFRELKRDMSLNERRWRNFKDFIIILVYLLILVGCMYLGLFVV